MVEIPILVIALFDLQNTTAQVPEIEKMLECARNKKITLVPVKMEMTNQIYFRDINLDTFRGVEYRGQTDDRRALRSFVSDAFQLVSKVLSGREKIIVFHSTDYEDEAKMIEALVKGQRLQSEIIRSQGTDLIL